MQGGARNSTLPKCTLKLSIAPTCTEAKLSHKTHAQTSGYACIALEGKLALSNKTAAQSKSKLLHT